MKRVQTLVQLTDEMVSVLDQRSAGMGRSRSELIREAITEYLANDIESDIDKQIVAGYTKTPPKDIWGEQAAKAMIEAEPW